MTGLLVGHVQCRWRPHGPLAAARIQMRRATATAGPLDRRQGARFVRFTRLNRLLTPHDRELHQPGPHGMTLKFSYTGWAPRYPIARRVRDGRLHPPSRSVFMVGVFHHPHHGSGPKETAQGVRHGESALRPDSMLPTEGSEGLHQIPFKWFVGRRTPEYGRWTYWEKFDYFAVFWGIFVIGSTGLTLWFPEFFTRFIPGWVMNVATIIHSDEALLRDWLHLHGPLLQHAPASREVSDGHRGLYRADARRGIPKDKPPGVRGLGARAGSSRSTWLSPIRRSWSEPSAYLPGEPCLGFQHGDLDRLRNALRLSVACRTSHLHGVFGSGGECSRSVETADHPDSRTRTRQGWLRPVAWCLLLFLGTPNFSVRAQSSEDCLACHDTTAVLSCRRRDKRFPSLWNNLNRSVPFTPALSCVDATGLQPHRFSPCQGDSSCQVPNLP